jgi:SpoVK/Ycf46/Vps4 family AAA+-type ATPase
VEALFDGFACEEQIASHAMTEIARSPVPATRALRIAEARVEDVSHAIARLAPADLLHIGARAGDVLKITGGTSGVARAELSDERYEGMIQIDGTCRSNCSAGLQEQVTVARIESEQAVSVRLSPLWAGPAPATIAPDRMLEESEAKLREVFEEAAHHAPAILFIDEIDAVAPKRTEVVGEVEKRVVAQLLSLMDGFVARGQVVVIGATNIPEVLDPALRRPGRFDREIEIGVPNTQARLQILRIHTRAMPLAPDVDLQEIAEHTHGFVGADLEALGQEVGMIALRGFLSTVPLETGGAASAELGTLQVTRDDFLAGLKEVEPSATREFFIEKSTSTFASLGGLNEVKRLLDAVIEHSHMRDEIYEQVGLAPPRGILLVGPSGTGKTAMVRALSGEKQVPLIAIDGPQLYSKWLGESERALREVFKKARRTAPCILFFDAIDAVAPKFGADQFGTDVYQRILSQLLREIDNLRDFKGVILLAATNRPERIEPALLRSGRFDYILPFAKPDFADRAAIMRLCCRRVPLAPDVDFDEFAGRMEGLTGADIESLCKKATLLAIVEFQDGTRIPPFFVLRSDFLAVLESERGSPKKLKKTNALRNGVDDLCSAGARTQ